MTADVTQTHAEGGLRGFLEKGGFWRLLLLVVVYLSMYLASGWVAGQFASGYGDDDLLSSLGAVFFQLTVGLVFGAVDPDRAHHVHGLERRDLRPSADLPVGLDVDRTGPRGHPDRAAGPRHRLGRSGAVRRAPRHGERPHGRLRRGAALSRASAVKMLRAARPQGARCRGPVLPVVRPVAQHQPLHRPGRHDRRRHHGLHRSPSVC